MRQPFRGTIKPPPDPRRRELERRYPDAALRGRKGGPGLQLLALHDDDEREFAYAAGAEASFDRAREQGWTVVSMRNDWAAVFADTSV